MNTCPERFGRTISVVLAFVLVIVWSVITLADAYSQRLADMDNSYNRGFSAVYVLDDITAAVDRLGTNQRAFLSTSDLRFSDEIWMNIVNLGHDLAVLKGLAARNPIPAARVAQLSAAIGQVQDSIAHCDDLRDTRGKRAALACLDSDETAFAEATSRSIELKTAIIQDIINRNRNARRGDSLLRAVFHRAPAAASAALRLP